VRLDNGHHLANGAAAATTTIIIIIIIMTMALQAAHSSTRLCMISRIVTNQLQHQHQQRRSYRWYLGLGVLLLAAAFSWTVRVLQFDWEKEAPPSVHGNTNVIVISSGGAGMVDTEHSVVRSSPSRSSSKASSSSSPPPPLTTATKRQIVYSHARRDRSGAALQDMMQAHATAWRTNHTSYGGACISPEYPAPFALQLEQLLDATGLSRIFRFACPDDKKDGTTTTMIWEYSVYVRRDTAVWTSDWRKHVRSFLKPHLVGKEDNNKGDETAVHVRRGDVHLCNTDTSFRYLPNSHYLQLLREYYHPTMTAAAAAAIIIYSETQSVESWEEFVAACRAEDYPCNLQLDTNVVKVWQGLVTADTIVLSKSSLSLTAAALAAPSATVIYTPFWHEPLPHWTVTSRELAQQTLRDVKHLQQLHCNN